MNHKYYQWVCFTLFFQSMLFFTPGWLWTWWEAGRMNQVVPQEMVVTVTDSRMPQFPRPYWLIDANAEDVVQDRVTAMRQHFERHRGRSGSRSFHSYFLKFVFCEILTLINVIGQIFFINLFLGGMFTTYGGQVWEISNMDPEDRYDPMNLIFPKVAKCTFRRNGPSGTIETFDGLCVLPVNIINEKIYIFLWYWLVILTIITCIYLGYRLITFCSKSTRKATLRARANMLVDNEIVEGIIKKIGVGDWWFLCQLGANLDPVHFQSIVGIN